MKLEKLETFVKKVFPYIISVLSILPVAQTVLFVAMVSTASQCVGAMGNHTVTLSVEDVYVLLAE